MTRKGDSDLRRVWKLLFFEEPPSVPTEGTFLAGFLFEAGLLLLRTGAVLSVLSFWLPNVGLGRAPEGLFWYNMGAGGLFAYFLLNVAAFETRRRTRSGRLWRSLNAGQLFMDILFATLVVAVGRKVDSAAAILFLIPLLMGNHVRPGRRWYVIPTLVVGFAFLALSACAFTGGRVGERFVSFSEPVSFIPLVLVLGSRMAGLAAASVLLRLYRVAQLVEREQTEEQRDEAERRQAEAESARREMEKTSARLGKLNEGTECGITLLRLDGSIAYWNRKHKKSFAPPGANRKRKKRRPCFNVFHGLSQPCFWCGLDWNEVRPARWEIDTGDLKEKVNREENWAISNQLKAGTDARQRLHLYHIYFGPVYKKNGGEKTITHVVEAVTEISDAVLEMPFLLKKQHSQEDFPEGLPPIGVLTADNDRKVIGVNSAKLARCEAPDGRQKDRKEVMSEKCVEAWRSTGDYCEDCPAQMAIETQKPAKGLTDHPRSAMVTAVPLFGPRGEVRAIFEFIDDIDELVKVEHFGRVLNALENESDVVAAGLSALADLANADRCVLWQLRDRNRKLLFRGVKDGKEGKLFELNRLEVPLIDDLLKDKNPVLIPDMKTDARLGRTLRRWARICRKPGPLGPAVLIPILTKDGDILAIADAERGAGQEPFGDKEIVYCRLLTGHFAAAMARARELDRRNQFIEAMNETADILSAEMGARKLVEKTAALFPEEISLAAYLLKGPPRAPSYDMIFAGGGGPRFEEEAKAKPAKWRCGQPVQPTKATIDRVFKEAQAKSWKVPPIDKRRQDVLVLDDTRYVRLLPFIYTTDVMGCLVAESTREEEEKAFPSNIEQLLQVVAKFGSIILGRAELLKGCMLSLHGHELGKPLGRIQVLAQHLQHQLADIQEGKEDLAHLWQLVNNCIGELDIAHTTWRIVAGESNAPRLQESVNIVDEVCRAIRTFQILEPQSEIDFSPSDEIPLCFCDPRCIRTCVSELLANAFKFGGHNRIDVEVTREASRVHISVSNDGTMPEDPRLFDPFYRGEAQHKRIAGSGLGLWRVKTLICAHAGCEIRVSNHGPPRVTICLLLLAADGKNELAEAKANGQGE